MNVTHCSKRHACLVSAFVLLVGQATFVNAQQKILIDFGSSTSYRGIDVPNPDPNGNYWNSNQPGMLMDLVDVNNAATGMQLGWITEVGTDSYNGPAGDTSFGSPASNVPYTDVDEVALGDFGVKEAAFDFATGPNEGSDEVPGPANNTRFDLIGLDPAKTYSLSFYARTVTTTTRSLPTRFTPMATIRIWWDKSIFKSIILNRKTKPTPKLEDGIQQGYRRHNRRPLARSRRQFVSGFCRFNRFIRVFERDADREWRRACVNRRLQQQPRGGRRGLHRVAQQPGDYECVVE